MSDTTTARPQVDDGAAQPWQPSSGTTSFGSNVAPTKKAKSGKAPQAKPKRGSSKREKGVNVDGVTYVPLPQPKAAKPLSKSQQKAADKARLTREREADAAAMRINGVDGDVEIPKKPWLTFFSGKRARPDEVAETLTDLASMLESGESERSSVSALAEQYSNYDIGEAYGRVVLLMDRSVTLADAMADQTDNFPPVVRELLSAANVPADFHRNLRQAAIIIVEADNIKAQIKSALFQPGLMAVFLAIFVVAAVQFLMPMTEQMFNGLGAETPPLTQIVMAVGDYLRWVLLAPVAAALLAALFWFTIGVRNKRISTWMDGYSLRAPLVGEIMRMSVAARFVDVLGACLNVGMSELEALETASRACGNKAVKQWVDEHIGRQRAGVVEFTQVAHNEMFPYNFRNRIETSSSLPHRIEVLRELAETFHRKAQLRLNRFAERVGPITQGAMVIVIVVVVLIIVMPILTFIPTLIEIVQ